MAIAVTADLVALRSDITGHGVSDWAAQLAMSESDVVERVKTAWFPDAARSLFGYGLDANSYQVIMGAFDIALLNTAALKNLVCYHAMSYYIYPNLTRDVDDGNDAFSRRAERYKVFYEDEWNRVSKLPLYDFNGDSAFTDIERQPPTRRVKVYRA